MSPVAVFRLFLGLAIVVAVVFLLVARSTRRVREVDYKAAGQARKVFFFTLTGVLTAFLGITLPRMPYPREGVIPDRVVHVVGKQFAFAISETPIETDAQWEEVSSFAPPVRIPVGSLVEFRVTSFDVNHGFSVYSPQGRLLAQTQAMPGYVNRLRLRLNEPGRYTVLCLEFCGSAHHRMRGVFFVE
ncbi:Cytochrome c oxidase subunit 2 [bacterium HR10]|nr:Cytochrome c oxidase subunit 2 [bacterium HR10]